MKRSIPVVSLLLLSWSIAAQEARKPDPTQTELYREVPVVTPGLENAPPSDAVVLFSGKDLNEWQKVQFGSPASMEGLKEIISKMNPDYKGDAAGWNVENEEMVVEPGTGGIATKRAFGDVQLHIEWLAPKADGKSGQGYSNSGVFFMGLYEVQI